MLFILKKYYTIKNNEILYLPIFLKKVTFKVDVKIQWTDGLINQPKDRQIYYHIDPR